MVYTKTPQCRWKWWILTSPLCGSVNIHHRSPPLRWIIVNYYIDFLVYQSGGETRRVARSFWSFLFLSRTQSFITRSPHKPVIYGWSFSTRISLPHNTWMKPKWTDLKTQTMSEGCSQGIVPWYHPCPLESKNIKVLISDQAHTKIFSTTHLCVHSVTSFRLCSILWKQNWADSFGLCFFCFFFGYRFCFVSFVR